MENYNLLAVDFETNPVPFFDKKGKNKLTALGHPRHARPLLISFSDGQKAECGKPDIFSNPPNGDSLIFHNAAFDLPVGINSGTFSDYVLSANKIQCTFLMARILRNDTSAKLKELAKTLLGEVNVTLYEEARAAGGDVFLEYAKRDALYTAKIFPILQQALVANGQWQLYKEVELPFMLVNMECEKNGLLIDRARLKTDIAVLRGSVKSCSELLGDDTNWNSPDQVKAEVFGEWNLPLTFYKGKLSTSRHALKKIASDDRVKTLLEIKEKSSRIRQLEALSRFIDPETGAIHPYINTLGADTGRCTSSNPNLQNINKDSEQRNLFIARPGHKFIVLDFSQIEPRVLAHFLNQSSFSDLFFSEIDFYTRLAKEVFSSEESSIPSRDVAKQVVLATFYGMGNRTLAENLKTTPAEAGAFLERFFTAFPEIARYRDEQIEKARRCGFAEGLLSRRRYIADLDSSDEYLRLKAERKVLNAIVQGSATTVFKYKLVQLRQALPPEARFLLHVHDEVILEVPEDLATPIHSQAVQILERPIPWFSVPLKVEGGIGDSWSKAKNDSKGVMAV